MSTVVLFVEDDDRIRLTLRVNLEDDGFVVREASNGTDGILLARNDDVDVALIDLLLPDMHGFGVVREIRKTSKIPIVILTALSDTHDVVAGLEAGADDYLVKPVAPKELAARIRALVRRASSVPDGGKATEYVVGPIVVRPDAGMAFLDGKVLSLTRTEFRILCELAVRPETVVSRDQLLERVWGYDYLGDLRLVDSQIYRLRNKLEVDSSEPAHLVTVRGMGYKLVP